jgi:hypothetical protein
MKSSIGETVFSTIKKWGIPKWDWSISLKLTGKWDAPAFKSHNNYFSGICFFKNKLFGRFCLDAFK